MPHSLQSTLSLSPCYFTIKQKKKKKNSFVPRRPMEMIKSPKGMSGHLQEMAGCPQEKAGSPQEMCDRSQAMGGRPQDIAIKVCIK